MYGDCGVWRPVFRSGCAPGGWIIFKLASPLSSCNNACPLVDSLTGLLLNDPRQRILFMKRNILEGTKALHEEMKAWMNHMHQYPELALQETETAKFIAQKVKSFGYDVVRERERVSLPLPCTYLCGRYVPSGKRSRIRCLYTSRQEGRRLHRPV